MRNLLIASAAALWVAACGGGGGGGSPSTPAPVASIAVQPAALTLSRGDSIQLSAILKDRSGAVLQGRTVTWSSDDAAKASVSVGGLLSAVGAGMAKVTAAAEGKVANAEVVVVEPAPTVDRVTLNTASEVLQEGTTFRLEATAYDSVGAMLEGRAVRWSSNDPGAISVGSDGVVTALRPGIASVTATIEGREASATIRAFADYAFELVYSKGDVEVSSELYSLDINDPAAVALQVFPGKTAVHAAPSPDGAHIAFVVHGKWDGTYWQAMIYVADRDGRNAMRLTYLPARNVEPVWSPDGRRIAFSSQPEGARSDIWVMDVDGANLVNLTADVPLGSMRSPTWSPVLGDGTQRIAYALESGGASFIWTMRADGSDKLPLTSDERFWDSEPAWSPDGNTLVFQRTGEGIIGDLHLIGSTGGAVHALMPATPLAFGQFGPAWSPDGRLIAFASKHGDGHRYQIWTVWADGTRLAQRTQEPGELDAQAPTDPAWIVRL